MPEYTVEEASLSMSRLLERVAAGEAVEIVGVGAAGKRFRVFPIEAEDDLRTPGSMEGEIVLPADFDDEDHIITAKFGERSSTRS